MKLQNGSTTVFSNNYGYDSDKGRLNSVGDGSYIKSMLFLQTFFLITLLVSCNSNKEVSLIIKKDNVYFNNIPLYKIQRKWEANRIEKIILNKLEQIHQKTVKSNSKNREVATQFLELVSIASMTLGNDTLIFLHSLRSYYDDEYLLMLYKIDTLIRSRLELINLLKDYKPQNQLETKIINRVLRYSPNICNPYYSDYHNDLLYPLLKTIRIGPLKKGKFIIIKCFGIKDSKGVLGGDKLVYFDIGVERRKAPKGGFYKLFIQPEEFNIPLEKRGNNIFTYDLHYKFGTQCNPNELESQATQKKQQL